MTENMAKSLKLPPFIAFLVIFGILALNGYALYELAIVTQSWKIHFLPARVSTQLIQLAIILGVNCVALIYLLIDRFSR
jgi:hypothetical protein